MTCGAGRCTGSLSMLRYSSNPADYAQINVYGYASQNTLTISFFASIDSVDYRCVSRDLPAASIDHIAGVITDPSLPFEVTWGADGVCGWNVQADSSRYWPPIGSATRTPDANCYSGSKHYCTGSIESAANHPDANFYMRFAFCYPGWFCGFYSSTYTVEKGTPGDAQRVIWRIIQKNPRAIFHFDFASVTGVGFVPGFLRASVDTRYPL